LVCIETPLGNRQPLSTKRVSGIAKRVPGNLLSLSTFVLLMFVIANPMSSWVCECCPSDIRSIAGMPRLLAVLAICCKINYVILIELEHSFLCMFVVRKGLIQSVKS